MNIYMITPNEYPEHKGGVPYYNQQLLKNIPYKLITLKSITSIEKNEIRNAMNLNTYAIQNIIPKGSIILGEGIWGNIGIDNSQYHLISICHGLWGDFLPATHENVLVQKEGYCRSKIVVACSYPLKHRIQKQYKCNVKAVPTMVDPSVWKEQKGNIRNNVLMLRKNGWEIQKWNEKVNKEYHPILMQTYYEEELIRLYSSSSCFVHLTRYEGNSIAILKALSCNCPVISTAVGIFDGMESGLFSDSAWICREEKDVIDGIEYFRNHTNTTNKKICSNFTEFIDQWKQILLLK